jgi:diguanylate cyclase (GGDEF)-like protein
MYVSGSVSAHRARRFVGALVATLVATSALLAGVRPASAAEPAALHGCRTVELDRGHVEVARDPTGRMQLEDALHAPFEPAPGNRLNLGLTRGSVWLRFALIGGGCDAPLYLDLGNPFVNLIIVYREQGDGGWEVEWATGNWHAAAVRGAPQMRYGVVPVQVDPRVPTTYVVEMRGPAAVMAAPSIVSGDQLPALAAKRTLVGGLFAGGILALALYCACLAALTRFRGLLAHAASASGFGTFYAVATGVLDQPLGWITPAGIPPVDIVMQANGFGVLTCALFQWLFVRGLLQERQAPLHRSPALLLLLAAWLVALASVPMLGGGTLILANMAVVGVAIVAIVYELRQGFARGHPLARVTAVGFGALALPVTAYVAMYAGLLPWHPVLLHALAVGAWVQTIVLSVAVGTQVKALRGQQERLAERTRELSLLSQLDPLTGLGNRRAYDVSVPAEIERCRRRGRTASLLVLDIDHFKRVNDTFGHVHGDAVIRALGAAIANSIRSSDFAFRYGGEEFVVLLPGLETEMALAIARRIMHEFAEGGPSAPDGSRPRMTVSVGLAQLAANDDAATLFERADTAMYRAKQNGRARAEVADLPH